MGINITNAFIQPRVKEKKYTTIINIRGVLVYIMCFNLSTYKPYVNSDREGFKQLLVHLQNNLYGKIIASIIYYRKFTKSLTDFGFEINPYNPCVTNKMVDGSHITICFHVDDCKLSHRKCNTNDHMIEWFHQENKLSLRMYQVRCW